jgi:acyl-CoA hydrolase
VDNTLRKAINNGEVMFIDQHLSETVEQMRNLQLKKPDVAIIEALRLLKMAASFQQLWVTLQASQFCRKSDC